MGSIVIDKRLIDAVRAEQCLYDSTTRDYRDMEERNAAWMRVASIIGSNTSKQLMLLNSFTMYLNNSYRCILLQKTISYNTRSLR